MQHDPPESEPYFKAAADEAAQAWDDACRQGHDDPIIVAEFEAGEAGLAAGYELRSVDGRTRLAELLADRFPKASEAIRLGGLRPGLPVTMMVQLPDRCFVRDIPCPPPDSDEFITEDEKAAQQVYSLMKGILKAAEDRVEQAWLKGVADDLDDPVVLASITLNPGEIYTVDFGAETLDVVAEQLGRLGHVLGEVIQDMKAETDYPIWIIGVLDGKFNVFGQAYPLPSDDDL